MSDQILNLHGDPLFRAFDLSMKLFVASLLISIAAAQILIGILVCLWVVLLVKGMRQPRTILDIPILIFIAARIASVLLSEYPELSIHAISRELVFYVSYFVCTFYFEHADLEGLKETFQVLVISTCLVCIASTGLMLGGYIKKANGLSGGGLLSSHIAFLIPAVLMTRKERGFFPKEIYRWGGVAILLLALLFTLTRGDWIAVGVVIVVYGMFFSRKAFIVLLAVFVIIYLFSPTIRGRVHTFVNPLGNTSDRKTLWQDAAKHAGAHPLFGFGPNSFSQVFDDRAHLGDKAVGAWHNDFLQLYMESGIAGAGSFAVVLGTFGYCAFGLVRRKMQERPNSLIDYGWMGALLLFAYIIDGCFTMPTSSITNAMLFRFLIAAVAVEYARTTSATVVKG
jgi:O-antigen ligase